MEKKSLLKAQIFQHERPCLPGVLVPSPKEWFHSKISVPEESEEFVGISMIKFLEEPGTFACQ